MDDPETLNRRARLRELVKTIGGRAALVSHIERRTGKRPNEGEISALQKDNGGKSFGYKKAGTLCEQVGLNRRWFEFPVGTCLDRAHWLDEPQPWRNPESPSRSSPSGVSPSVQEPAADYLLPETTELIELVKTLCVEDVRLLYPIAERLARGEPAAPRPNSANRSLSAQLVGAAPRTSAK